MIGLFAADLISKSIVENTMAVGQTVTLIPNFLNVHKLHNYAAAFGSDMIKSWFGDIGSRIFFSVFAVAASVAFILVLIKQKGKSKLFRVAIAMFVAGAMGNCIDRMALGYVRDFIEFVYFGLEIWGRTTWYVFNLADAFLVCGVILIVIYFIFIYRDNGKSKDTPSPLTTELLDTEPVDAATLANARDREEAETARISDGSDVTAIAEDDLIPPDGSTDEITPTADAETVETVTPDVQTEEDGSK